MAWIQLNSHRERESSSKKLADRRNTQYTAHTSGLESLFCWYNCMTKRKGTYSWALDQSREEEGISEMYCMIYQRILITFGMLCTASASSYCTSPTLMMLHTVHTAHSTLKLKEAGIVVIQLVQQRMTWFTMEKEASFTSFSWFFTR